jgi:hypothetical protein
MKKLALSFIALACWVPFKAQATTVSKVSCNADLMLPNQARIFYDISGTMKFSESGQLVANDPPNLSITILRREPDGAERFLRTQELLGVFGADAPTADYAQIPFSDGFKAQSKDGSGIYHVRSADHGIYLRLLPSRSAPQQVQVVHFLSRYRFVRSAAFRCSFQ